MRVLVTGVKGQLGYDVCKRLDALHIENKGVDLEDFDLTCREQVDAYLDEYRPDAVVHCAAYTAVDAAESNETLCMAVNAEGTRNVARACNRLHAKIVYPSTDYVFEGSGNTPFETDSRTAPQNVYGRSKLAGELAVAEMTDRYFIVRISWVFGVNGKNFVKTMLRLGAEKESLTVVDDQVGSPTYTVDLSVLICDMLQTERYGVYHATNEGMCSWWEFAQSIMRIAQLPCRVMPVSSAEYPSTAKRPLNSRMSKRSLDEAGFVRLPSWENALRRYLNVLKEGNH
ncbi:MAG: dTDP-4-dehydrorhamnose reductase [Raoultibacter sp.]